MLLRRLRGLIDRTVLSRVNYRGRVRLLQVSSRADTALDGVEHLEPYGFTSHPLPGAEALVANLGGNSGRAIVILVNDRRHRIVIAAGETAIYHHDGDVVHIKNGGEIHVKAASKVFLETPLVECSTDLHVLGNAQIAGTALITGAATMQAGLSVAGVAAFAGSVDAAGDITSEGDIVAGDISVRGHHHNLVQPGSGISGDAI